MKILTPGNKDRLKKYRKFECEHCGCVFIADKDEYKDESTQKDGPMYSAKCPCCENRVWSYATECVLLNGEPESEYDEYGRLILPNGGCLGAKDKAFCKSGLHEDIRKEFDDVL